MTSPEKTRVAVLDGLRALAIILVLMRHGIRPFWTDLSQPFLPVGPVDIGSLFLNGWMGVDLFFVLSGYLIASHLLGRYFNEKTRSMDLKTYAKRRFLRIAPAYYAVLTLAVLGLFPWYPYPESHDNIGWRYLYHLLFLQDYLPSDINVVFWSLAVEIKFYLLAPFLLMGLLRIKKPVLRIAALGAVFLLLPVLRFYTVADDPGSADYMIYFERVRSIFHLTLDGLVAGTACALIWKDKDLRAQIEKPPLANMLFFTGAGLFLTLSLSQGPLIDTGVSVFGVTLLPTLVAFSFAAMLLGLRGGCSAGPLFAWRGWFRIALVSYGLYLLHLPMMYPAEIFARSFIGNFDSYAPQMKMLVYAPFFIAFSAAAATASYYLLEKPFLVKK